MLGGGYSANRFCFAQLFSQSFYIDYLVHINKDKPLIAICKILEEYYITADSPPWKIEEEGYLQAQNEAKMIGLNKVNSNIILLVFDSFTLKIDFPKIILSALNCIISIIFFVL